MRTTIDILATQGIAATTIEEVSRRSGVAKTTIYRRYRNTDDLLHHLQIEAASIPNFDDLDPTREGLQTLLSRVEASFNSEIGLKAVGVVLSTGNEMLHGLARKLIQPTQHRFTEFIERGQVAGAFRHNVDASFLFATTLGSMLAFKAFANDIHTDSSTNITSADADTSTETNPSLSASTTDTADTADDFASHSGAHTRSLDWAAHTTDLLWPALEAA